MPPTRLVVDIDKILAERPDVPFVELLASQVLKNHCHFHEEVYLVYTDQEGLQVTLQVIRPFTHNQLPPLEGSH